MIALIAVAAAADLEEEAGRHPQDYAAWAALARASTADGALVAWRHAGALSAHNAESRVGVVDALLALGRVREARDAANAAAEAWPDDPRVALALARAEAPRLSLSAGMAASAVAWGGQKARFASLMVARATWDDTAWFEASGRIAAIGAGASQTEVYARFGAQKAGSGAELLLGLATVDDATAVVGGRAWVSRGPLTVRVGGALTGADGRQLEGHLLAALGGHLAVSGGLRYTTDGETDGLAAELGATWTDGRWSASAVARFGTEVDPVRLDEPTLWNLGAPLDGSGALGLGYRVDDRTTLGLGVELLHQEGGTWATVPTAGVTVKLGGSR